MLCSLTLVALLAGEPLSIRAATDAIAHGEDNTGAAVARMKSAGQPGLWALCDAAKKSQALERGRLFEAVGKLGGSEAEWALIAELKGSDPDGRAGALRGLAHIAKPSSCSAILKQASAADGAVRDAVVDALVALEGCSESAIRNLFAADNESSREVALRFVVKKNPRFGSELIGAGLSDPSPRVRLQAVELATLHHDRSQLYTLAEIARGADEHSAVRAVQALDKIGGWNVPSELAAVIADAKTTDGAWREAAAVLHTQGKEGYTALLRGLSRTHDSTRRGELAKIAAKDVTDDQLIAAIELLEDPETVEAGRAILDQSGVRGVELAKTRLTNALPELSNAIESYLASLSARGVVMVVMPAEIGRATEPERGQPAPHSRSPQAAQR